jgi:hypothetical protein
VRVISLLRSAVAEPGRRLNGALVILTLIVGVVVMHSMSGSPTSHHASHDASVVAIRESHATTEPPGPMVECSDGCGDHDTAMAMCLMILVALLALAVPVRRLLWQAQPAWSAPLAWPVVDLRAVAAPSLHELCISRT